MKIAPGSAWRNAPPSRAPDYVEFGCLSRLARWSRLRASHNHDQHAHTARRHLGRHFRPLVVRFDFIARSPARTAPLIARFTFSCVPLGNATAREQSSTRVSLGFETFRVVGSETHDVAHPASDSSAARKVVRFSPLLRHRPGLSARQPLVMKFGRSFRICEQQSASHRRLRLHRQARPSTDPAASPFVI